MKIEDRRFFKNLVSPLLRGHWADLGTGISFLNQLKIFAIGLAIVDVKTHSSLAIILFAETKTN
jgi:hypothetical protein